MIFGRYSIALLGLIALQVVASPLELVNDMQTCIELCDNCGGTADFGDNVCQCHVQEDDQRGAECIGRIKRQAQELGLDVVSCDLASTEADRPARCILSPFRRFKSRDDADLIAKYFMENPLGGFSSFLGSGKSETDKSKDASDSEKVSSTNEDKREVQSNSDSQIVGAPNPLIAGQYIDLNPLIGLAPAWLHPQTLFSLGNGFNGLGRGSGTPGLVGAQNPNYGQTNYVGSPEPKSWNLYSLYPTDSMLGMSPYSYYAGGAPNPIQYGDENYYGYDPSLVGNSYTGLSPYPSFPVEQSDSQVGDPAPLTEGSLNENAKTVGEPVQESDNSGPSLGANKDAALENGTENLESIKEEDEEEGKEEEPVVNSKRTADDIKVDAAALEEIKEQSPSRSKSKLKRRQSKLKSKSIPKDR